MAQRGHAVREYILSEYRSLRMSEADNKLEGLLSLIDETGIFQHSEYRIIDRRYGYRRETPIYSTAHVRIDE